MKILKKNNGITLIALVISVIVILVLAGISLNAAIGDNGIIAKAQNAKLAQERASAEEEVVSMLEYYQMAGGDTGITINDIESIELLQKYVDGKINGFSYSQNGTTTVYYTNSNGSYTVKIDSNGIATTYDGIYVEKNQTLYILMDEDDKITLSADENITNWSVVSGDASVNSKGEVIAKGTGTIKIVGTSSQGYTYTVIINGDNTVASEENQVTSGEFDLSAAIEVQTIGPDVKAYIVKDTNNKYCLVIKGNGEMTEDIEMENVELVQSIIIEEGVTSILDYAFCEFKNTETLTIPKTVNWIGDDIIADLENLNTLNYDVKGIKEDEDIENTSYYASLCSDSITEINFGENVEFIPDQIFFKCYGIETIVIPDNVNEIGEGAFYGCDNLKYISLGNGVETIDEKAFYDCNNLKYISLGSGLKKIGESAFSSLYGDSQIMELIIPENVTNIDDYAFSNCEINTLKYNAISCNSNLEYQSLVFRDTSISKLEIGSSVKTIAKEFFKGISDLEEVVIPDTVEEIGSYAFDNCSDLKNIKIGKGVKKIGEGAFMGYNTGVNFEFNAINCEYVINNPNYFSAVCDSWIETLTIGNGVKKLPKGIFSNMALIETIYIPSSVTTIEESVFENCTNLSEVTIGYGIQSIAGNAFSGCYNLTNIIIKRAKDENILGTPWDCIVDTNDIIWAL